MNVNLDEYQRLAKSTAIYPPLVTFDVGNEVVTVANLFYGTMKLGGEIGELQRSMDEHEKGHILIAKEVGDVAWYVADLAGHLGLNMSQLTSDKPYLDSDYDITQAVFGFQEAAGKYMRKNDPKYFAQMKGYLVDVWGCLLALTKAEGLDLGDTLELNLDKLLDRSERGVLHGQGDER